ncbi:MAG TPA: copper resistance CopC family protein [Pseudonocardia sp.]|nr:copper resistance CopC family protein [Pseudonocardia sp.]
MTPHLPGRVLRALALAAATGFALLLGATPALAHTQLVGTDPADGASLDTGPEQVTLTFNEDIPAEFSTITVVGPDGGEYQTGPVTASGNAVSTAVGPLGPAGPYEIGFRVVSDDGHPVTGSVTFTLTAPGPAAGAAPTGAPPVAPAPPPAAEDAGMPAWPWIAGAAVLVVAGVGTALRLGRS